MQKRTEQEYRDHLRRKAQRLARAVLAGEMDLLEAAEPLWRALLGLGFDEWEDEDASVSA